MIDVTLLTQKEFLEVSEPNWYTNQVLQEDELLIQALREIGLTAERRYWDDPKLDLNNSRSAVFRAVWDYFIRFNEFEPWLEKANQETQLINPLETVKWNIHKSYLRDLNDMGVNIPKTHFIAKNSSMSLGEHCAKLNWKSYVLKPAIAAAARHTYRFSVKDFNDYESIYRELNQTEMWLLQEFQPSVLTKGEVTHVLFDGRYSHSLLKQAKKGDFRIQDDFGGRLESYVANEDEIAFAVSVMAKVKPTPVYGRVDVIWDSDNRMCVSELELIEPELWLRLSEKSSALMASAIKASLAVS